MGSVKTAISVDEDLFARANAVAREQGISRSEVFARALDEYLRRIENKKLLDQINAALAGDDQVEELDISRRMRRHFRKVLDLEK